MRKAHAFVVSSLLAGSVVAGALAAMKTAHLGAAASKPSAVAGSVIAAQQGKLNGWSVSLRKALKAKPPALPKVPHFAPVEIPAVPSLLASAPAPAVRRVVHRTIAAPARKQLPAAIAPLPTTTAAPPAPVVTYVQAVTSTGWSDDSGGDAGHDDGGGD